MSSFRSSDQREFLARTWGRPWASPLAFQHVLTHNKHIVSKWVTQSITPAGPAERGAANCLQRFFVGRVLDFVVALSFFLGVVVWRCVCMFGDRWRARNLGLATSTRPLAKSKRDNHAHNTAPRTGRTCTRRYHTNFGTIASAVWRSPSQDIVFN